MGRVAVVQMTSISSVVQNLKNIEDFFVQARDNQAELVVLPENFAFMGKNEQDKRIIAEVYGQGPIQEAVSRLAKTYGLWTIAGTIPLQGKNSRLRASCLVYDEQGKCTARYDKIHLFDVRVTDEEAYQESLTIERGEDVVVVDTPVGRVGLSVCYDVRFPELYQKLAAIGADLFSIPAAFTAKTGVAHWEVLLRARAIENLCYVLGSNQEGHHENDRDTHGHSMIVEPWGKVISEKNTGSGVIIGDIDLQRLCSLRRDFPCNEHHVLLTKT